MAAQTLPVNLDLTVYAGTTFRRELRWRPGGTTGQDFTGWAGSMRIGPARGAPLLEIPTGDGLTLGADGSILIELSPAETRELPGGVYAFVLDLTDTSGTVMRLLRGRLSVVWELE